WVSGDDAERVGFLLDLAQKNGLEGWVLIPTGDEGAALVARHHSELAKRFRLTTPPWHILRWAYDKRLTYQLADKLQVSHPRTVALSPLWWRAVCASSPWISAGPVPACRRLMSLQSLNPPFACSRQ